MKTSLPVLGSILLVVFLSAFLSAAAFQLAKTELILDGKNTWSTCRAFAEADPVDGGSSLVSAVNKGEVLVFDFKLGKGYQYPYVVFGLECGLGEKKKLLDLSPYDSVKIFMSSSVSERLIFSLYRQELSGPAVEKGDSLRLFQSYFPVEKNGSSLALRELHTPNWWFRLLNLEPGDNFGKHERIRRIVFQNSTKMPVGLADHLELRSLHFSGIDQKKLTGFLLAIPLLWFLLIWQWLKIRHKKAVLLLEERIRTARIKDGYRKLPLVSNSEQESRTLLDYLAEQYSDAELSLEGVCSQTGLNRAKVAEILKRETGLNFKAFLNTIRLAEAARQLRESDQRITEVAYLVGYNNVSYFNRVFKDRFGQTPSDFRNSQT